MASNVFGNPITNSTLEGMPEYLDKTITRTDRAHVALNMKNAGGKDVNARTYVENLKAAWGDGVSTLCVVYNATGDVVEFATAHDWHGHIGAAPYPQIIENGQWGAFLHVKTSGTATGSAAAVVYRGLNENGNSCDWMLCWSIPWSTLGSHNHAYTEIREAYHMDNNSWEYVDNLVGEAGLQHKDKWNGCVSTVIVGQNTSPVYEGIMTLTGA
ncbi:hypothetical protein ACHQM5_018522 [Ranunculus cassubicifolius]